jgi:DNA (cytosine-5)-methyltransferase 1
MPPTSYVSVTDLFCGAGGSSLGATQAGAEITTALNHWKLAIETHNSNFPNARHECVDISACEPRRYPDTTVLIASPECTNHTLAKGTKKYARAGLGTRPMFEGWGLDPAAERSRATMWDVVRFAEAHPYDLIIVENVVEARQWMLWESWWHALTVGLKPGYDGQCVYLNSQFAWPTPQSRDRLYAVFWRKGLRRPDLDIRPWAWCPVCGGNVQAVQSWKKNKAPWGRYERQYLYLCPHCGGANVVRPYYYAAANAIDWNIPAPRIGDRKFPLKPKTVARIEAGLRKFTGGPFTLMTNADLPRRNLHSVTEPLPTQPTAPAPGLCVPPFIVALNQSQVGTNVTPASAPLPTQTTAPIFGWLIPFTGDPADHPARPLVGCWPTQTGYLNLDEQAEMAFSHAPDTRSRPDTDPLSAQTTRQTQALVTLPFLARLAGMRATEPNTAIAVTEPTDTQVAGASQHALVTVPLVIQQYGTGTADAAGDPLSTVVAGGNHHALCTPPPFLVDYHRTGGPHALAEALGTLTTVDRYGLVQPAGPPAVADCGFRILLPHEVGAAMAFPASYQVLGTGRDKVRQYGNAVTPPAMALLLERCLAVLH